jgi:RNA polymerase sigma factor (sigma-70 family)
MKYPGKSNSYTQENFKHLVSAHRQMVFTACMGVLHNTDDANDITQDVFLKAYENISSFRGEAEIKTWLYRIAINKSINALKRLRRVDAQADIKSSKTEIGGADRDLEENEIRNAIQQALSKLPENQHKAFVLSKYNDLSYKEIAEIMNTSLSSVESLLHRAKQALQKHLLHFYEENIQGAQEKRNETVK